MGPRERQAYGLSFDWAKQAWRRNAGRPPSPGIVLYARVDGGFGVWDPARNYWRDAPSRGVDDPERPASFLFDIDHVWNGLRGDDYSVVCKGLLQDWVDWQYSGDVAFDQLTHVLGLLSPPEGPPLRPGRPARVSIGDVRDVPTLVLPYGEVPILQASAGMRRVVALGYLLVWAFREHIKACELLRRKPETRIIFLIDEIEAHLHPRWQRAILPAVLDVAKDLSRTQVQVITTTHSPFVPLSVETMVTKSDRLWDLDLVDNEVKLSQRPWEVRGDAMAWATSNLFDLKSTRSRKGEAAIERLHQVYAKAEAALEPVTKEDIHQVDEALAADLPELDPVRIRWSALREGLLTRRGRRP